MIAETINTQTSRVHFNHLRKSAIIDLKRNRHVHITLKELEQLKEMFECKNIIVSSPIRCKMEITFCYHDKKHGKCCCGCKV